MKSVSEIKKEIDRVDITDADSVIQAHKLYEDDERQGVKDILARLGKKVEKLEAERARLKVMRQYEERYSDYALICGVDEVGRGPLAGPVMAGAVILPRDCEILYLNDSKQLSEKKRDELCVQIKEKAIAWGLGIRDNNRIDEINIRQATLEAMRDAIAALKVSPDMLFVDAMNIPGVDIKQIDIVKGDARSVSIAAASIVAKVERDALMTELDKEYPGYGFASNKGYGSAEHIAALKEKGPCPIHRKSFISNFV